MRRYYDFFAGGGMVHAGMGESVSSVEPRGVRAYLKANGWKKTGMFGDKGDVYETEGAASNIVVPVSSEFADYAARVVQIAETLGEIEERAVRAVLRDLSLAGVDLVRVGAQGDDRRGLRLNAGVALVSMARELLFAAACAADRPQKAFGAGGSRKAASYLGTVRLGHTETGSYVVTLLSPVAPPLDQSTLIRELEDEPFPRKVTRVLAQGLAATRRAVDLADRDEGIAAFEDRVGKGVSANLCAAIANLLEHRRRVGIAVSWALTRRSPERTRPIVFRAADAEVLQEAARVLRERQERPNHTITGYVRALKREEGEHHSRATVKAVVDGALAPVEVDFSSSYHPRIGRAYDHRFDITLDGELRRRGQRWHLDNPRNLYVSEREA